MHPYPAMNMVKVTWKYISKTKIYTGCLKGSCDNFFLKKFLKQYTISYNTFFMSFPYGLFLKYSRCGVIDGSHLRVQVPVVIEEQDRRVVLATINKLDIWNHEKQGQITSRLVLKRNVQKPICARILVIHQNTKKFNWFLKWSPWSVSKVDYSTVMI